MNRIEEALRLLDEAEEDRSYPRPWSASQVDIKVRDLLRSELADRRTAGLPDWEIDGLAGRYCDNSHCPCHTVAAAPAAPRESGV